VVLARSGDRGLSFEEIVRIRPPIGSRRTIWKELMRGYKEQEYRKEPPEVGPGRRGRWYFNPPRAFGTSKSFNRARLGNLKAVSNALPREDAPVETQAQELADLLFVLSLYRSLTLVDLLAKALKAKPLWTHKTTKALGSKDRDEALDPRDVAAICSFIGRTGYLDEAWDDPALLVLLDRRNAAPEALEIFRSHLDRELRELGLSLAGHDGESVAGRRPRAGAQLHPGEGAEEARSRRTWGRSPPKGGPRTRGTSEQAAGGSRKVRRSR